MVSNVFKNICNVAQLILKFLLKSFNLYIKVLQLLIQFYIKVNIKIVYLFSNNIILYGVYLLSCAITLFSFTEITNYHWLAFFLFYYPLMTSIELYALCKISYTEAWLKNFLTDEFLANHLGDAGYSRPLILFLIGFLGLYTVEFGSLFLFHLEMRLDIDAINNLHRALYGTIENWTQLQKVEHIEDINKVIFRHNSGLVGKLMAYLFK